MKKKQLFGTLNGFWLRKVEGFLEDERSGLVLTNGLIVTKDTINNGLKALKNFYLRRGCNMKYQSKRRTKF